MPNYTFIVLVGKPITELGPFKNLLSTPRTFRGENELSVMLLLLVH